MWYRNNNYEELETYQDGRIIYHRRCKSYYDFLLEMYHDERIIIADDCKNPYILKWWNKTYDNLIVEEIKEKQWYWTEDLTDKIVSITPSKIIELWKEEDPLCQEHTWYNVLWNFAKSRAYSLSLIKKIKEPKCKICPLCGENFLENSLPFSFVKLMGGIKRIDFCYSCLSIIYDDGIDTLTRQEVLNYFKELTNILQRVPNYDFGRRKGYFIDFDTKERLELLKLLKKKLSIVRIKELFGSWFNMLIEAEILEDGVRKTSRGTHCLAKDGHHCLSLGEKTIDDFCTAIIFLMKRNQHTQKVILEPISA